MQCAARTAGGVVVGVPYPNQQAKKEKGEAVVEAAVEQPPLVGQLFQAAPTEKGNNKLLLSGSPQEDQAKTTTRSHHIYPP